MSYNDDIKPKIKKGKAMPAQKAKKPAAKTVKSTRAAKKVVAVSNSKSSLFTNRVSLLIVVLVFAIVGAVTLVLTRAASSQGEITSAVAARKCLDNSQNKAANNNKIQLYTCNSTNAQKWTVKDNSTIVNANGYCLDVAGAGKTAKTLVQLYKCNNTVAQQWTVKSDGSIVNPNSGLCLDVKSAGTANGTQIWMWPCNKTVAQKWTIPAKAPTNTTPPPATGGGTTTPPPSTGGGTTTPPPSTGTKVSLFDPTKKEIANELVSSAENSSLNWKAQYAYIEDIGDSRGYTAGIIGFCTGCGDMVPLVNAYTKLNPSNVLAKYLPALKKIGSFNPTHAGLDPNFTTDWKTAAKDAKFQQAQNEERDRSYFNPAVNQGIADGIGALGQFIYYDAMVVHGPGSDSSSFGGIRAAALKAAKTPAQGGNETTYLNAFMDARVKAMKAEAAHEDVTRIENAQRVFLKAGNLNLDVPLKWSVYGDPYSITKNP
jgi:chitosanase